MATIKLDVTYGYSATDTLDAALADLTRGLNVQAEPTGVTAGGGNPEVAFSGSRDDLTALVRRYVGDNDVDLAYVLSSIAE